MVTLDRNTQEQHLRCLVALPLLSERRGTAGLDGPKALSATVTVVDTAPSIEAPGLSPDVGGRVTSFDCSPGAVSDPDPADDPLTWGQAGAEDPMDTELPGLTYEWWLDGAPVVGAAEASYTPSAALPSQKLQCAVTASDGQLRSGTAASGPITLINEAPSVASVTLNPGEIDESTLVGCEAQG